MARSQRASRTRGWSSTPSELWTSVEAAQARRGPRHRPALSGSVTNREPGPTAADNERVRPPRTACLSPLVPQAEQYLHARPYSAGPRGPA